MAFLRKTEEKNEDNDLYEKSGDEDDRLRKEYHNGITIIINNGINYL